jgi:universal stress protein A
MQTKTLRNSKNAGRRQRSNFPGIRHIVVPVDFSDASLSSLRYAAGLARKLKASITVVHVVPIDYGWLGIGQEVSRKYDTLLQAQAANHLRQLVNRHIPSRTSTTLEVRIGRPAEQIIKAAEESKSDLIVLSTYGRTGIDRVLMGSVAERVAHLAPCPVLLVRFNATLSKEKRTRTPIFRLTDRPGRNNRHARELEIQSASRAHRHQ